jgi:hypothetical protein
MAKLSPVPEVSLSQEDHASMATYAARRLLEIADNAAAIVAIELLAAAQGIELRRPLQTSMALQAFVTKIRQHSAFLDEDRPLHRDIGRCEMVLRGFAGITARRSRNVTSPGANGRTGGEACTPAPGLVSRPLAAPPGPRRAGPQVLDDRAPPGSRSATVGVAAR